MFSAPTASASASATALAAVHRRAFALAATKRPQAVDRSTEACDVAGTIEITWNDADNNGVPSRGDTLALNASNCAYEPGAAGISGSFSLTINSLALDANDDPTSFDFSGTFNGLTSGSANLSGGYHLTYARRGNGGSTLTLAYTGVTVAYPGSTLGLNTTVTYDLSAAGVASFALSGTVAISGENYLLQQELTFSGALGTDPATGTLRLSDAAGDSLRLVAKPAGQVGFEFVPATGAVVSLSDQSWSAYR